LLLPHAHLASCYAKYSNGVLPELESMTQADIGYPAKLTASHAGYFPSIMIIAYVKWITGYCIRIIALSFFVSAMC
jgi:hypothetical protein